MKRWMNYNGLTDWKASCLDAEQQLAALREYSIKMENYLETVDKPLMAHGLNIRFSIPNRPLSALLRQEVEGE
jgi:hypothetical protein